MTNAFFGFLLISLGWRDSALRPTFKSRCSLAHLAVRIQNVANLIRKEVPYCFIKQVFYYLLLATICPFKSIQSYSN